MGRFLGGAAALLVVVVVGSACSSDGGAEGSTSPTVGTVGSAVTPDGGGFSSAVYGYDAVVPAGWAAEPATSQWEGGDISHTAGYADRLDGAGAGFIFTIGTPTGDPLAEFADAHVAWVKENRGCPQSSAPVDATLDGAPAVRVVLRCPKGIYGPTLVSKAMAVHDGVGVIVTSFSPDAGSDTFPEFDQLLASVRWTGP
jgi:hypothetical protein